MYDPRREFTSDRSDVKFGWRETWAFALVLVSLAYVVIGGALTASQVFNDTQAIIWAGSAIALLVCAAFGFCRLVPSEGSGESTGKARQPASSIASIGRRITSAVPFGTTGRH